MEHLTEAAIEELRRESIRTANKIIGVIDGQDAVVVVSALAAVVAKFDYLHGAEYKARSGRDFKKDLMANVERLVSGWRATDREARAEEGLRHE